MAYQVLVGLGSNLRNRRYCLNRATDSIHADCGKVIAVSSCYESEAVGGVADRRFLNAVLLCQTDWPPQDFLLVRLQSKDNWIGLETCAGRIEQSILIFCCGVKKAAIPR